MRANETGDNGDAAGIFLPISLSLSFSFAYNNNKQYGSACAVSVSRQQRRCSARGQDETDDDNDNAITLYDVSYNIIVLYTVYEPKTCRRSPLWLLGVDVSCRG
jgi:hypothetical protein